MNDWVLIPWGNGFLKATEAEFAAIMGRGLTPSASPAPAPRPEAETVLLDARAMGQRLGTTAEWVEAAGRAGRVPSVRVGRYVRFDPRAVLEALGQNKGG